MLKHDFMVMYSMVPISMCIIWYDSIQWSRSTLIIAILEYNLTVDMLYGHLVPFHSVSLAHSCDFYTANIMNFFFYHLCKLSKVANCCSFCQRSAVPDIFIKKFITMVP